MRKTKKKDRLQKTIDELMSILDKDYFHVCIEVKDKDKVEWSIYYKNLPEKAYFSKKNKPLLTSQENGLTDIHLLNEKFEKEKNKELMQNLREIVKIISTANFSVWKFKEYITDYFGCICIFILLMISINVVFIHNIILSIVLLAVTIINGFCSSYYQKKITKEHSIMMKNIENEYIKEKIKHLGFYFVERIKIRKD